MRSLRLVGLLTVVFAVGLAGLAGLANAAEPDGKAVYQKWCLPCHTQNQVGAVMLQMRYKGAKPAVLTQRDDLIPAVIKAFVRNGAQVMPIFRKTEISDAELDALATYVSGAHNEAK